MKRWSYSLFKDYNQKKKFSRSIFDKHNTWKKSDSVELGDVTLSRDSPCQATHLSLLSCIIYNWRKGSFQKCMIALLTEEVFGGSLPMDQ